MISKSPITSRHRGAGLAVGVLLAGGIALAACDGSTPPSSTDDPATTTISQSELVDRTDVPGPSASAAASSPAAVPTAKPMRAPVRCKARDSAKPLTLWQRVAESRQITVFEGTVYLLVATPREIQLLAVPVDGSAAETLATLPATTRASSFAVDVRGVYLATSQGILRARRGQPSPDTVSEQPLDRIALYEGDIFGSIFDRQRRTDTLVEVPGSAGVAKVIASRSTWSIRSLAVNGRYVYLADSDGGAKHAIHRVPLGGGEVEQVFVGRGFFRQLIVDGDVLYWFTYDRLYRLPKEGEATALWTGGYSTWASPTASDGIYIYAFESAHLADAGWLYRIAKADGAASKVDSFRDDLVAMAVDEACFYLLREERPSGLLKLQAFGKPTS